MILNFSAGAATLSTIPKNVPSNMFTQGFQDDRFAFRKSAYCCNFFRGRTRACMTLFIMPRVK